ncbi:MAG: FAD-dependent oxidoreductase, partial [Ignavibacteriae bacterium]|nr:FAD-dependent oxidoreductase [Ignavibacteriota bacterium]
EHVEVGHVTDVAEALDVARSAVRFGAKEVHVVCLEDWNEMPATKDEISEALEERIFIHPRKGPSKIHGSDGKVVGFETIDCVSVFDEQKRFNTKFAPGTETIMEADTVIMAIGQSSDLSWIKPEDGIEVTPRNTVKVDPLSLATSAPGIYSGGDLSFGPRNAIDAVANGKRAAKSIHEYLQGMKSNNGVSNTHVREVEIIVNKTSDYKRPWAYEQLHRIPIPALPINRRIGVAQVELVYSEELARREASRCLHCWVNTIFETKGEKNGTECILCGGCADICPESCIELVSFDRIDVAFPLTFDLEKEFDVVLHGQTGELTGAVMMKDEDRCIRCGLCAMRCPVGCITMESYSVSETIAA